jgi:PAS domain S-box-containing protein
LDLRGKKNNIINGTVYAFKNNQMLVDQFPHIPTDKSARLLRALIEIGQELASTTDLEELLDCVLRAAREVFQFENAIIRLLDEDGISLVTAAAYGYTEQAMAPLRIGQGVMGRAAAELTPILVEDITALPDYVPGIPGAQSELAVPLINKDRLVGVLNVESPRPGAFSREDIDPLLILGRQAAIAIGNARLYERLRNMSDQYQRLNQLNDRMLKSINLGVYTVDTELTITSWNRSMAEMSGVPAERAVGARLPELFPTLLGEGIIDRLNKVLEGGSFEKLRLVHRTADGSVRFQKRRLAPLKEGDDVIGVVVIVEDITEYRRLLDQTIQSEKLAELGRLSAGIAHEINNPLSLISYATQLLGREGPLNEFQQEMLDKIDIEVDRMKTLTGGLLSFSSSRESYNRLVDLNTLVDEVLRLIRYDLQRKAVQIVTDYSALPLVQADPNKLKQVIINLLMNAAQAIGQGQVELKTTMFGDDKVELAVRDDGPWIADDMQDQIFEPFFTTKPEGVGTGLGLYICRNIIQEHGGEILLESELGVGSVFRVRLPAS